MHTLSRNLRPLINTLSWYHVEWWTVFQFWSADSMYISTYIILCQNYCLVDNMKSIDDRIGLQCLNDSRIMLSPSHLPTYIPMQRSAYAGLYLSTAITSKDNNFYHLSTQSTTGLRHHFSVHRTLVCPCCQKIAQLLTCTVTVVFYQVLCP